MPKIIKRQILNIKKKIKKYFFRKEFECANSGQRGQFVYIRKIHGFNTSLLTEAEKMVFSTVLPLRRWKRGEEETVIP